MRPLFLLLTPDFLNAYHQPVADLGVTQVRYTENNQKEMDSLHFELADEAFSWKVDALAQRLREEFTELGIQLIIVGRRSGSKPGALEVLWSWDEEKAKLKRESERLGVSVMRESSGRWAARTNDGLLEYGKTEADALGKLVLGELEEERVAQQPTDDYDDYWRNQVDPEIADYLDNQEDD